MTIWNECGGTANLRTFEGVAWRSVESQQIISTRKLVDSIDEQWVLEQLLDEQKPRVPTGPEYAGLHYLLFTPFRYPPLRYGSRFGTRSDRGIWYGSEALSTLFAEVAYYRFLFVAGTKASLPSPLLSELTVFRVALRSARMIDLTLNPFTAYEVDLASPTSYAATHAIGSEMREAGVEVFRFRSARDERGGGNFGVFTPRAFARKEPLDDQTWLCAATPTLVEVSRKTSPLSDRSAFRFPRADFEVGGLLPAPSV